MITAQDLYHSRKEEIDRMAKDSSSPVLQRYAKELIELTRGGNNAADPSSIY